MKMRYFSLSEFDQKDGSLPGSGRNMDAEFLMLLDELRHRCGFPFVITSGWRSPEYNARVSSTGREGPHTTGKAVDIAVSGERAWELLRHAFDMGFTGIGVQQKGTSRFIHLDTLQPEEAGGKRPRVWSY